jgi:hypothetical protein
MIAIEHLDLISGQPTWMSSSQGLAPWLRQLSWVAYEGRRNSGFDAIMRVGQSGSDTPIAALFRLIGGGHDRLRPEHDFIHQRCYVGRAHRSQWRIHQPCSAGQASYELQNCQGTIGVWPAPDWSQASRCYKGYA